VFLTFHEIQEQASLQEIVQEVSQEELEQQVRLERMSFISGSSANEEEDDFEDNDVSSLNFPPLPPAPSTDFSLTQPKSSRNLGSNLQNPHQPSHYHHIHQTFISMPPDNHISGGREATPMIHTSSLGFDDSNYRPTNQTNEMIHSWGSAGDIDECLPQSGTFASGTVRRKNKRERNRTNPEGSGVILFCNPNSNDNSAKICVGKSNTSLESTSEITDVSHHNINTVAYWYLSISIYIMMRHVCYFRS
jgi:hypothetical protein